MIKRTCPHCGTEPSRRMNRYCDKCRFWIPHAKSSTYNNRLRAIKFGLKVHYTYHEWLKVLVLCDYSCCRCGENNLSKIVADHIVSLSCGGDNTILNIQPLCKSCNNQKWSRSADYRPQKLLDFFSAEGHPITISDLFTVTQEPQP